MQIIFLGTSSMVPTKDRNHSSIYLEYKGEGLLFDCGEGTQRQIKIAGIKPSKIKKLVISHWHGDHVLGIPGLIQTLSHNEYTDTLEIYGPSGTENNLKKIFDFFSAEYRIKYKVHELKDGDKINFNAYSLEAYSLIHPVPCLGYRFIEKDRRRIKKEAIEKLKIPDSPLLGKLQRGQSVEWKGKKVSAEETTTIVHGKKIGLIFDTRINNSCYAIAKDADLLISESTYTKELEENAKKFKHLTSTQAGHIAKESNSKKLVLTHFSQRYKDAKGLVAEAKKEFKEVKLAEDFMKITV